MNVGLTVAMAAVWNPDWTPIPVDGIAAEAATIHDGMVKAGIFDGIPLEDFEVLRKQLA